MTCTRRIRAVAATLALACLLAGATTAHAETSEAESQGFAVSPLRFDVKPRPGKTVTARVTVTNTHSIAMKFRFSKEDFEGNRSEPGGTPVLLGGKFTSDISGYDWITAPEPVTIAAGESESVAVKVTAPEGAKGGHYAALVVEGQPVKVGRLSAQSRIGVLFLMNAGGVPPPDIVITEVTEYGPTRTETVYVNNGETDTTPDPTLELDPLGPGETVKVPGECTTALPGGTGTCEFDPDHHLNGDRGSLTPGPHSRMINLDPGGEGTSARAELPVEWAGTWTSMLLPIVGIVLAALYFLFLRRRRKDGDDEGSLLDEFGVPLT